IRAGKVQKGNKHKKSHSQKGAKGQNQENGKFAPKPKIPPPPKRENPAKDSICHEDGIFEIDLSNSLTNESSVYVVSNKRAKLDLDSALLWHCRLGHIRYPKETMGYSFYYPSENKVLVARNAEFLENSLIDQEASGSLEDLEVIQEEDAHPSLDTSLNHEEDDLEIDEPQSDIVPIRRSTRTRHAPDRMCLYIDAEEHELGDLGEPANYKATLLDPDKWLFKKKTDMDGNVHIYKARLVAKGFTQTPGIDYEETFSPVADIRAIRILIAIATYYDYEIWQMDVKTAFLNGYLNEEEKLKLSKSQGASTPAEMKRIQNVPYTSAVGSIIYAVRCTRLDVAFAQNITSRFQQNPGDIHWTTVKNILKYLRNTKDMFLVYGGDLKRELRVSCYTDAGYLTDADDLKSQTGYVFVLNGGAVDWKSAKQSIFATSSAEADYIAAFDAFKEAVWVRKFISGLSVVPTIKEPISMYCDNTGAIAIANESGITKGARHFRAKVHYLREVIELGDIKLE
nr:putative retrotransposon protein [Tanacetum cinerariifolium]